MPEAEPNVVPIDTGRAEDIQRACIDLRNRLTSPVTTAALDHWLALVRNGRLPGRQHLDPAGMVPFLPHVLLMDVDRQAMDFRYRLVGKRVRYHLFRDPTGLWLSEIPHQKAPSVIHSAMSEAVRRRVPIIGEAPYVGPQREYKKVEDIQVPLARDGRNVDMLFIVVDYILKS
ncbi:MAG: PAS domain-containing protein [Pseudomonadota bacterium]|nr:PAS domain-containing protein [Pseudomonadota bacterium]